MSKVRVDKVETTATTTALEIVNVEATPGLDKPGIDVNMYVSGSTGSKDSVLRGTSVFTGDMHISGNLSVNGTSPTGGAPPAAEYVVMALDSSLTNERVLTPGANVSFGVTATTVTIDAIAGAGGPWTRVATPPQYVHPAVPADRVRIGASSQPVAKLDIFGDGTSDQVLMLSGSGAKLSPNEASYNDINFFVSGSTDANKTSTKGTALFGGSVVTSGSLEVLGIIMAPQTIPSNINIPPNYNAVWWGPTVAVTGFVNVGLGAVIRIL